MQTNVQTRSGNRIVVQLDGVEVGLIQSVRGSDDYGLEPASGVGDAHMQEYVPGAARHTVNVSAMVLIKNNLRGLGLFPENADQVLKGQVFDIVEYDKDSKAKIRAYHKCSYASGDVDISKHQITVHSGVFMALDVSGTGV